MTTSTDGTASEGVQPADTPVDTTVADPQPPDSAAPTPNNEAARYRVQLREAQAERDALAERLTEYQRRECEAAVANLLDQPADLWDIGQADVSAFYADDGTLNEAELQAAAGALIEMRPRLAKPLGPRWQNFGQGSQPPPQRTGWDSVIGNG